MNLGKYLQYIVDRPERWYCVHTAPARENMVAEYLQSKNLEVYNPLLAPRSARAERKRPEPLFPRYIFARFALNRYEVVRYGHGVVNLVSDVQGPLPVLDEVIEEIQSRLEHGFYQCTNLKNGDRIIVQAGVFKGVTGIFQTYTARQERVRILMELMKRPVIVEVNVGEIEKASGRPA
jgi:transcriptional antiterminator RfaH